MSKIFKASNILMNDEDIVLIDVPNLQSDVPLSTDDIPQGNESIEDTLTKTEKQKANILETAKQEAERTIQQAKDQAEKIVREAQEEGERIRSTLMEEGKREGYEVGYSQGVSEAESIKAEAQQVYDQTVAERDETFQNLEPEILELIISITKKLLMDASKISPQVIINLIRQGLQAATITDDISILVSKDDYDSVIAHKEEIASSVEGGAKIDFIKDFTLNKSDCIIETPFGNVDCSLDRQFESLKENLIFIYNVSIGKDKWM